MNKSMAYVVLLIAFVFIGIGVYMYLTGDGVDSKIGEGEYTYIFTFDDSNYGELDMSFNCTYQYSSFKTQDEINIQLNSIFSDYLKESNDKGYTHLFIADSDFDLNEVIKGTSITYISCDAPVLSEESRESVTKQSDEIILNNNNNISEQFFIIC